MINDDLKTILKEMRTYNVRADQYQGDFIIPGWADRIERALIIELPTRKTVCASGYGNGYLVDSVAGEALDYDEVIEVLTAAGVTVKSD